MKIFLQESERFEVNPSTIKWDLFKKEKKDPQQEKTRKIILSGYQELEKYPEEYNWIFETMVPKKKYPFSTTIKDLEKYAIELGGFEADLVWQALEWAQQISNNNGSKKAWKKICNDADTSNSCRLLKCKNGCHQLVGGSLSFNNFPASDIYNCNYCSNESFYNVVPLVVFKKIALNTVK